MITFKCEKGAEKFTNKILEKLNNERFINACKFIKDFDPRYTDPDTVTGWNIIRPLVETSTAFVRVGFYTQSWFAWKFTPVNAYTNGKDIFINRRQLGRSDKAIEETLWHELVHVSDSINKDQVYWHGDNSPKGKMETAPWKFSSWAVNWKDVAIDLLKS